MKLSENSFHIGKSAWVINEYIIIFSKKLEKSVVNNLFCMWGFLYSEVWFLKVLKNRESKFLLCQLISSLRFTITTICKVALSISSILYLWPRLRITLQQHYLT